MTQQKLTMYQLEKDLIEELNDNKKEILEHEHPGDLITEYADGYVPIYNSDLIDVLGSDHTLTKVDDYGLLPKNPNVHDILRTAINERLISVAYEWLSKNKKEVAWMSQMSLILIFLSLGLSVVFVGIVLAKNSIDECDYRNKLYQLQQKDKNV